MARYPLGFFNLVEKFGKNKVFQNAGDSGSISF